jgi:hypothetical protein
MHFHGLQDLVWVVIALVVLGLAFTLLQKIVTDATFLLVIRAIIIIGVVIWLLSYFFGLEPPFGRHGHP